MLRIITLSIIIFLYLLFLFGFIFIYKSNHIMRRVPIYFFPTTFFICILAIYSSITNSDVIFYLALIGLILSLIFSFWRFFRKIHK